MNGTYNPMANIEDYFFPDRKKVRVNFKKKPYGSDVNRLPGGRNLIVNGTGSVWQRGTNLRGNKMASGKATSTRDSSRGQEDTDPTVHALIDKASRMGLTSDIRDMIDDVGELKAILHKKNAELDILELLAMYSDDDNIIELREQLFVTVKLIHSDIIITMIAERENEMGHDDSSGIWITQSKDESKMDNKTILDKIRSAWYQKRELRRLAKEARRQIKEHLKNNEEVDYIDVG